MKKDDQISFASNRLSIQKFKVVLVGDQNAGKSSILIRYIKNEFDKTNNVIVALTVAHHRHRLHQQERYSRQ